MTHFTAHSTAHNRSQLESLWQMTCYTARAPASPAFTTFIRQFTQELLLFFTGTQQMRVWTKSTNKASSGSHTILLPISELVTAPKTNYAPG